MARRRRKQKPPSCPSTATKDVTTAKVWRPGVDPIEEGETLEYDPSTYNCLHAFSLGWPCLSFDILRDDLGASRGEFPHTMFCVAGTQAAASEDNKITVAKLSNLSGKMRNPQGDDSSSDESDTDSEDEGEEEPPAKCKIQIRSIAHSGCVNRVRAMPQAPNIVATWSAAGYVQIWDVKNLLQSLSFEDKAPFLTRQAPLKVFTGHKAEGYALDWSPKSYNWLASGDNCGVIHLWRPDETGKTWQVSETPLTGHSSSVEDIQWSPEEEHEFASCSSDGTLVFWDARCVTPTKCVKAHDTDVNVIAWNRGETVMLVSGGDDGVIKLWNEKRLQDGALGFFKYHTAPITSLEWSPHCASTLAVTSADNMLSIWDFAVEADREEEIENGVETPEGLPPQLLFVHQGQTDMKEVHWHPQIPGLLVSTSLDGFNVFQPSNLPSNIFT